MAYDVRINGTTTETSSYAAATNVVREAAIARAAQLAIPVPRGVYRSPKTTARVNADRLNASFKVGSGIKFPKTAGDVAGSVGGLNYVITRK